MCFYRHKKNLKSNVHSDYINNCNASLSLLTHMKHDYMHRLKLAIIKSIPNTLNVMHLSNRSTSYIFMTQNIVFIFSPKFSSQMTH
jgi:hypothetical protein